MTIRHFHQPPRRAAILQKTYWPRLPFTPRLPRRSEMPQAIFHYVRLAAHIISFRHEPRRAFERHFAFYFAATRPAHFAFDINTLPAGASSRYILLLTRHAAFCAQGIYFHILHVMTYTYTGLSTFIRSVLRLAPLPP